LYLAALVAVFAVALASCGGGEGPSVRAELDTTTSSSTTSTTTEPGPTTTTSTSTPPTTVAGVGQIVTFGGISLRVPADWPVHALASDPTQCVRFDIHAAYLGQQGPNANCPAHLIGRTEAVQIEQLDSATQLDAAQATQPLTINGLNARSDPDPDSNGALTVVFPDQQVVVILAYGTGRAIAEQILASVATA
jgi:hypothetical protein